MSNRFTKQLWINIGIIIGGFVVLGIGLSLFGSDITAKSAQVVADKMLIAQRTSSVTNLATLKATAAQADEFFKRMNLFLPVQDQLFSFPQYLTTLGSQHQLIVNVAFQGAPTQPTQTRAGSIGFAVDLTGSLNNIKAFFSDIESRGTKYLVNFDAIDLSAAGDGYHGIINGRVFFQAGPSAQTGQ
jgi:Tfp pilus assembly protein PilO